MWCRQRVFSEKSVTRGSDSRVHGSLLVHLVSIRTEANGFFLEGNSNILRKLSYLCTQNAEKDTIMTKEEAMTRFMAAKEKKRQCVARLEEKMKQSYEQRTGKPANYTFVL